MSNMPDVAKTYIGFKLETEIVAKARRESKIRKQSLTDFVDSTVRREIDKSHTKLTVDDVEWIKKELDKNVKKRNNRRA